MRVIAMLALFAALGCSKKEEEQAASNLPPSEPISAGEAELGRQACAAYVAQVCACAPKKPELKELAEECEMGKARPDAFEMNVRAAMAEGDATSKDRRILIANSRKIMRACIEDQAALVKKGCPLEPAAPPPPPAPAPPEPAPAK